ncbi:MAG TPA: 50S ribosomal protein L24 [Balneolales bacterium]|nr:50S ribosomal protein L24 [Balneolales bacterium]
MPRKKNHQKKLHVKRGDIVEVIAGNDKGKRGKVLQVLPKKDRVIVEGVNIRVRHEKPSQQYQQGGRMEREMSIHVSNVMPLDPVSDTPTRVGRKRIDESGKSRWVRYAVDSGEVLDN